MKSEEKDGDTFMQSSWKASSKGGTGPAALGPDSPSLVES